MEKNISIFIDKLASKMGENSAKVSMIIETFVLGFSADLNAKGKIGFEPVGAFGVNKHLEYIEEREDGTRVLFPPRLEVVFSSSAIAGVLLPSDEAGLEHSYQELHGRFDMTSEDISLFIAQLKSCLKSLLLQEKKVVIPFIGSFEGDLGGDIQFTPDPYFAGLVNKPFSYFEPEVIVPEQAENDDDITVVTKDDTIASVEILKDSTITVEDQLIPNTVNSNVSETVPEENSQSNSEVTIQSSLADSKSELTSQASNESVIDNDVPALQNSEVTALADKPAPESGPSASNDKTNLPVDKTLELYTFEKLLIDKDKQIKYYRRLSLTLVALLFIVLASFFFYWGYWGNAVQHVLNKPQESVVVSPQQEITVPETKLVVVEVENSDLIEQDSVISVIEANIDTDTLRVEDQPEQSREVKVDSEPIYHKLKRGDTLRDVAYKYYKDKDLWTLIVDANPDVIRNPNRIPIGEIIKIPQLVE